MATLNSRSAYLSHFQWRRTHFADENDYVASWTGLCQVCAALHDKDRPQKSTIEDLDAFLNTEPESGRPRCKAKGSLPWARFEVAWEGKWKFRGRWAAVGVVGVATVAASLVAVVTVQRRGLRKTKFGV